MTITFSIAGVIILGICIFLLLYLFGWRYRKRMLSYTQTAIDVAISKCDKFQKPENLPSKLMNDQYFVGYIQGMANVCSYLTTKSMKERAEYFVQIMEIYFPDKNYNDSLKIILDSINDKDSLCHQAEVTGEKEFHEYIKSKGLKINSFNMIKSNNTVVTRNLPSLVSYLNSYN